MKRIISLIGSLSWRMLVFAAASAALIAAIGDHIKAICCSITHKGSSVLAEQIFAAVMLFALAAAGILYVLHETRKEEDMREWDRTERLINVCGLFGFLYVPIFYTVCTFFTKASGSVLVEVWPLLYSVLGASLFCRLFWARNSVQQLNRRYILRHRDQMTDEQIYDIAVKGSRKKSADDLLKTAAQCIGDPAMQAAVLKLRRQRTRKHPAPWIFYG